MYLQKLRDWADSKSDENFLHLELWLAFILGNILLWTELHQTIFGFGMDLLVLALVATVLTSLAWPLLSIFKKALTMIFPRGHRTLTRYGQPRWYWLTIFTLLLVPHVWMSAKLTPLREEFAGISRKGEARISFTGEYSDGRPINEMNFGGQLDSVVEMRQMVLLKYQFIPLPIGRWGTSTSDVFGPQMYMAYVYTFLPRSTYRNLLANISTYLSNRENPDQPTKAEIVRKDIDRVLENVNL